MQKLQALRDYLTAAVAARPEQIKGVMESGEPQASFDQSGPDLLIFRHRYVGTIVLDDYPHDPAHVIALVYVWLEENGDERTDRFLGWVGEASDDKLGDLDLRLELEEEMHYVVKPGGYTGRELVTWKGVEYVPGQLVAARATEADVQGDVEP